MCNVVLYQRRVRFDALHDSSNWVRLRNESKFLPRRPPTLCTVPQQSDGSARGVMRLGGVEIGMVSVVTGAFDTEIELSGFLAF